MYLRAIAYPNETEHKQAVIIIQWIGARLQYIQCANYKNTGDMH